MDLYTFVLFIYLFLFKGHDNLINSHEQIIIIHNNNKYHQSKKEKWNEMTWLPDKFTHWTHITISSIKQSPRSYSIDTQGLQPRLPLSQMETTVMNNE